MAAYTGLCNLERSQKNYEEALSWCQMAIDRFPEEAEPYFRTGRVYLEMSEFSEAIVWLVKALRYERTNENMWIRLAEAYEGTGNVEQALVAYQEALQLESDNAYVKRKLDELTR
jgi:superkiller protein 3